MFCCNCGKELDDNAKFCLACGARVDDQIQEVDPQDIPVTKVSFDSGAPKPPKKKGGRIAIVAVIALVLVGAVAAVLALGLFGSPAGQVTKALTKSAAAFDEAYDKMELNDLSSLEESGKYSQDISMKIGEISGYTEFDGLGLRLSQDIDLPGRVMDVEMTPFFGSADILSIQMKLDDAELLLGSPELTRDTFYMINTETIFQDLQNMGADMGEAAQISLNIFDLIEEAEKLNEGSEEMKEALMKAATELVAEIQVEKAGSETIAVHGSELGCKAYDVLIPAQSIHTFLDALKEAYRSMDSTEASIHMMESMGIPQEAFGDMDQVMEESNAAMDEAFAEFHDAVDELGDVTMKLYVSDGYVVSARYENTIDGTEVQIALNIGGGENYVDDVTLEVIAGGEGFRMTSTGNHAGVGDIFTDELVFAYVYDGDESPVVQMETSYAPKQTADNFSFKLDAEGAVVEMKGQLTSDKDAFAMDLDKIKVSAYGTTIAEMEFSWTIGKYEGSGISASNVKAFAGMTEDDLMAEAQIIGQNGTEWISNLDAGFLNLIMSFMY